MRRLAAVLVPPGMERRALLVLTLGHVASDMFQGALSALNPFLQDERGYTYAQVTALVLLASLASAFLQPLLGIASDRLGTSWMMPAGLLLAGAGIGLSGVVDSYAVTAVCLLLGGFGVAAFHPEAISTTARISGDRPGAGMSVFATGGNIGFFLGPPLAGAGAWLFGLRGTLLVGVIIAAAGAVVALESRHIAVRVRVAASIPARATAGGGSNDWVGFGLASFAAVSRGIVGVGLGTFIPLFLIEARDQSKLMATVAVTVFYFSAGVGTLVGGRIADRFGFDRVVMVGLCAAAGLTFVLPVAPVAVLIAVSTIVGALGGTYFYPLVVVAQQAIPRHLGLAAGVVLGMSIGIGSATAALLGRVADEHGTAVCMWILAAIGALAAPAAVMQFARARRAVSLAEAL